MTSTSAPTNALSASSLCKLIATALPTEASPQLTTPCDAVAIACHAGMLAVGFRLIGLGEDHQIEAHSDAEDRRPLPSEWNANSSHAFRYKHSQSSMEYLLKVSRLGNKTLVYGIGMGDDKTTTFDLTTKDFISGSSLPASPTATSATSETNLQQKLHEIYISASRLADLASLLRINVIQKLMPSLQKEGYEESSSTSTRNSVPSTDSSRQPRQPTHEPLRDDPTLPRPARSHPLADPSVGPPRYPFPAGDFPPPGFDDEYDLNRPLRGFPPYGGGGGGYPNIGERDLYPPGLGPNDPLRIGPGFRGGGGGGMHPTFDDPIFGGRSGQGSGAGYDPSAPPGARYDPLGPGDGLGRGRGGGRFGGGGMGGAPPNPFGGYGSGDFI